MAGPTIASAEVDVDLDGRGMDRQARRIAQQAGRAFSGEFSDEVNSHAESMLSPAGRRIARAMGDIGDISGKSFTDRLQDKIVSDLSGFDDDLADAVVSGDWERAVRRFETVDQAAEGLGERMRALREQGELTEEQYNTIGGSFERYRKSLDDTAAAQERNRKATRDTDFAMKSYLERVRLAKIEQDELAKKLKEANKESGRSRNNFDGLSGAFRRMDGTVKAVLISIATAGPQLSALGSGLSASVVGLLSSAIVGLGGSILALGGPLTAAILGTTLLATAWKKLTADGTALAGTIDGLSKAWKGQAKALAGEVAPGLDKLFSALQKVLAGSDIGSALGASLGSIAKAFAAAVQSPGFTAFVKAMETTIPDALAGLGAGAAGLTRGFAQLFASAGPVAVKLGQQFAEFGNSFAKSMEKMAASGQLKTFFDTALASLNALTGFLGPLSKALGNVFLIGAQAGNSMLGTLGKLADQFLTFTQSVGGQKQLEQWFASGEQIFNALLPLIGSVGTALADMVTPTVVSQVTDFLGQLAEVIPVVGQILSVIGNLNILGLIGDVLVGLGQALAPVLPALGQLATVLGDALGAALQALAPLFTVIADVIGQVAEAITPLVPIIGDALVDALGNIAEYVAPLSELFATLLEAIGPLAEDLLSSLLPAVVELVGALVQLTGAFLTLADGPVLAVITSALDLFGGVLSGVATALSVVIGWISTAVVAVAQLLQGTGPLADFFTTIGSAIATGFTAAITWIVDFAGTVGEMIGNIIGWFAGLPAQIGAAIAALPGIVGGFFAGLAANIGNIVLNLVNTVGGFFLQLGVRVTTAVQGLVAGVGGFFQRLATSIGAIVLGIVSTVGGFFGRLAANIGAIVSGIVSTVGGFFLRLGTNVASAVSSLVSNVGRFFNNLASNVGGIVSRLVTNVVNFFTRLATNIGSAVSRGVSNVVSFFGRLPGQVISAVNSLATRIGSWITGVFSSLNRGVTSGIEKVVSFFGDAPGKILSALSGAATLLYDVGVDLVDGLFSGLQATWDKVTGWASDAFEKLSGGVKKVLGIASPSKVFMKIGEDTVAGFVIGFRKQTERGKGSFKQLTQTTLNSLTDGLRKGSEEAGKETKRIIAKARDLQTAAIRDNQRALENTIKSVRKADLSSGKEAATIAHLRAEYARMNTSIVDAGARLRGNIRKNAKDLTTTLKDYESVTRQIDAARKKLDEMKKSRSQIADSLRGQLDLGSLISTEEGAGPVTFGAVANYVSSMKSKAQAFATKMKKLVNAGIPTAMIQQIAGLGLDGAIQVSDALLAGSPAQLSKLKQDFSAFTSATTSVSNEVVRSMYGLGVNAQKGLIDGLVSDQGDLKRAAKTFTDRLTQYVKKNLGIKSPSRVFATIGQQVMAGLAGGIARGTSGALSAMGSAMSALTALGPTVNAPTVARAGGTQFSRSGVVAAAGGRTVVVQEGAIQVMTPVADPYLVASAVLDRMMVRAG